MLEGQGGLEVSSVWELEEAREEVSAAGFGTAMEEHPGGMMVVEVEVVEVLVGVTILALSAARAQQAS